MSKRKRVGVAEARLFIDVEAQEDDQGESEDDAMFEEDDFVVEDGLEYEQVRDGARHTYRETEDTTPEHLAALAARFREETRDIVRRPNATQDNMVSFEGSNSIESEETRMLQMFLLPTKGGQELRAAAALRKRAPRPCVVLASRMLRKRIYVLAKTVDQVIGIASNASFMGVHVLGIKAVPLEDRGAVMYLADSKLDGGEVFERRSWVRMRRGQFRDDVGIIVSITDCDVLRVAVVPRFWNETGRSRKRAAPRGRSAERPPQGLLTEEVVRSLFNMNPLPGPSNDTFVFKGDVYLRNGLRIIEAYGIHAAMPVQPHAVDVHYFTKLGFDTQYITNKSFLRIGDHAEAQGVKGTVTYLYGDEACITNNHDSQKQSIKVGLADLQRRFPAGTTVVVRIGNETGRKGFVVAECGDELVLLEQRARGELKVPKAFVQTDEGQEFYPRPLTFASMNLLASEGKSDHALLKKLVYVTPRDKVGPITKVYSRGFVEVLVPPTKETANKLFTLSEVVDTETFVGLDGTIFSDPESVKKALATYIAYEAHLLVTTDTDLFDTDDIDEDQLHNPFPRPPLSPGSLPVPSPLPKKDATTEPPAIDPEILLGKVFESTTHSDIGEADPVGIQLPPGLDDVLQCMCTDKQEVYVLDPKFKSFGTLVAANGHAHAIVLVDGMFQPLPFPLKDVVSTETFRCLDESEVPDAELIRAKVWLRRKGSPVLPKPLSSPRSTPSSQTHNYPEPSPAVESPVLPEPILSSSSTPPSQIHGPQETSPAETSTWIDHPMIPQVMAGMRLYLRFVEGCLSPGDVSGAMAWTTESSTFRINEARKDATKEIFLSYRTRDGKQNEGWVQVRNLLSCQPRTFDRVLVLNGVDVGKIYQGIRFVRNERQEKTGILVRIGTGKPKTLKSFAFADVTRVSDFKDPV